MKNNKGMSLIELVMAMVILSIGLTGVFSVILYTQRQMVSPQLQWQAINIGDAVLMTLLSQDKDHRVCQGAESCHYELSEPLRSFLGDLKHYQITVSVKPYFHDPDHRYARVSVIVQHPELGQMNFTGIKGNEKSEKSARIYYF